MASVTYTIKSGDSLSAISKAYYGTFDKAGYLAEFNKIANKELVYPGQVIIIPDPMIEDAQVIADSGSSSKKQWIIFGGVLLAVAAVLGYEASKQHKKNKAAKPALSGPPKRKRKRKK